MLTEKAARPINSFLKIRLKKISSRIQKIEQEGGDKNADNDDAVFLHFVWPRSQF